MFCLHCGKKIEDNAAFCGYCGGKVDDVSAQEPVSAMPADGTDSGTAVVPKTVVASAGKTKLIAALVCVAIVFASAGAGLFLIKPWDNSRSSSRSEVSAGESRVERNRDEAEQERDEQTAVPTEAIAPTETAASAEALAEISTEDPASTPTPMPTTTPTPTPTQAPLLPGKQDLAEIIPTLDDSYITRDDLLPYTLDELGYLRNGIYALSGYIFKRDAYSQFFSEQSWYVGTVSSDSSAAARFNDYQKENLKVIIAREAELGGR